MHTHGRAKAYDTATDILQKAHHYRLGRDADESVSSGGKELIVEDVRKELAVKDLRKARSMNFAPRRSDKPASIKLK